MRLVVAVVLVLSSGCGAPLVFHDTQEMSFEQRLGRSTHIFVGVIQSHHFQSSPAFRVPPDWPEPQQWKVLRREVRTETLIRGVEPRQLVDVYEIFWMGGGHGDWNSTQDGERDLFLVRLEGGRYHVIGDYWRSIYPVTTGAHSRLPLDDSHPLQERIALMNWWVERSDTTVRVGHPYFVYCDVGGALRPWRTVKLLRGLVRHPAAGVRVPACAELLSEGRGLDECSDALSDGDRAQLSERPAWIAQMRRHPSLSTSEWWNRDPDREERRFLTTFNDSRLRAEFCRLYVQEYPGDNDNGYPADRPPPATIVTAEGDVPLIGPWPR